MNPMLIRYGFATLVLVALVAVTGVLVRILTTPETNEGLTALLGSLVTALGLGFTNIVRDLYKVEDGDAVPSPKPQ